MFPFQFFLCSVFLFRIVTFQILPFQIVLVQFSFLGCAVVLVFPFYNCLVVSFCFLTRVTTKILGLTGYIPQAFKPCFIFNRSNKMPGLIIYIAQVLNRVSLFPPVSRTCWDRHVEFTRFVNIVSSFFPGSLTCWVDGQTENNSVTMLSRLYTCA